LVLSPVVASDIAAKFLIGSFVGIALGLVWLFLLRGLARQSFSYMLTLAIVLFGYTASEYLGGSGALSSLLFGLVLGNEKSIFKTLKREHAGDTAVDGGLRRFESEIAFLIRTFFFVFLGLIAAISDPWFVFVGTIISLMLLLARFGVVTLATFKSELRNERPIMSVVLTRGLAAAVLATLPLQYANPEMYPIAGPVFQSLSPLYINLAVIVIVTTAIIATIGTFALRTTKRKG
jgi:cell volume regulation protein A